MNYFLDVVQKYAVFSGRARRKEYWMFMLSYIILSIVAVAIDAVIGMQIVSLILSLGLLLPSLGVTVRRLHDTDRSGWWILFGFIPVVGTITLLVFVCLDGEQGENKYGHNPKFAPAHI
jgi:uncharacterized membrane protein YhaH (DUF805 family)